MYVYKRNMMQNRCPSCINTCSSHGAATRHLHEGGVLLAQTGDTVPHGGCLRLPGAAVAAEVLESQRHRDDMLVVRMQYKG